MIGDILDDYPNQQQQPPVATAASGPHVFGDPVVTDKSVGGGSSLPPGYVPRDPATGQPLPNPGGGNGAPVSPADWQQYTADLGIGSDTNPQGLQTLMSRLRQGGYQVLQGPTDAQGRSDSLVINGMLTRVFDSNGKWNAVQDFNGSAWPKDSGSSGGQGSAAFGSAAIDPSYLAPFTDQFQQPGAYQPGSFNYPDFQAPGGFQAPTAASLLQDPSYQFRLDQGEGALQNSAAAKGLLNSGGTLKDILGFGQNFASQEYGNVWDRDFTKWNTDYSHALDTYGANRSNAAANFSTNYSASKAASDDAYTRAWQQYQDSKNTFYTNQNNPFNKELSVAQLGASQT